MAKLNLPIDSSTVDALRKLGNDLMRSAPQRDAFLADPRGTMEKYGVRNIDANKLDKRVITMLADPKFKEAVDTKSVVDVQKFIQSNLGDKLRPGGKYEGTFDADFDVEVEVEVVVVAVAVFDFALVKTKIPDMAEMNRRRAIVADAFATVGKKIG